MTAATRTEEEFNAEVDQFRIRLSQVQTDLADIVAGLKDRIQTLQTQHATEVAAKQAEIDTLRLALAASRSTIDTQDKALKAMEKAVADEAANIGKGKP